MKKLKLLNQTFIILLSMVLCLYSCAKEEKTSVQAPTIVLDNQTAIYNLKIGKTLKISPIYENIETAIFAWKIDGKIVATTPQLEYNGEKLGDKFVTLDVVNSAGAAFVEMKISVLSLLLPQISLNVPENGFTVIKNGKLDLIPTIGNSENATFSWSVDGQEKVTTKDYSFSSSNTGTFKLKLTVKNEDGESELSFPVKVCNPEDLPFSWDFEQTEYNMSTGRTIRLRAYDVTNDFNGKYIWKIDGKEVKASKAEDTNKPWYDFNETTIGNHTVTVTMKNEYSEITQSLKVNVCPAEGTYKRTSTATSSPQWNKVYKFLAAPGQFVNEGYTVYTMEDAAAYAEDRLKKNAYVSLGGFGGYIVVGFDHSIENDGDYNIQILGNSFAGSSEPGIVWVMQDENGDGLPNDTWYELKGCETDKGTIIKDYAVTYYKPKAPGLPVMWTDNQGKSGSIDYLGFHQQDYYYPLWASSDKLTFRGTCLPASNRETSPGYWYNGEFDWGYADNFSPIDRLTDDINYGAAANGNHFKISNAITYDGKPANLKYIDFVKISTGVNCKSGWLGEVSTEVFNVKDFNLFKNNKKIK